MKKMVHALEDKAGADLISANNTMMIQAAAQGPPGAADTHGSFSDQKGSNFHKRQGSLPPDINDRNKNNSLVAQSPPQKNNFVLPSISPHDSRA